jgi:protein TonB
MPEFPGGERAMTDFIQKHFRVSDAARESGQDMARVTVRFIVDSEGNISDVKLVRGVGYGLDEEALRTVRSFPKWKAGKQNGKAVPVIFTLPITVSIE